MNIETHLTDLAQKQAQLDHCVTDVDVIREVVGASPVYDINEKFKDTMPAFMQKLNSDYINTNNRFSGVIYAKCYALGKFSSESIEKFKSAVEIVKNTGSNIVLKYDETKNQVFLLGQKFQVLKSGIKLESDLKAVGVDFKNVLSPDYKEIDLEAVTAALQSKLLKFDIVVDERVDIALLNEPHVNDTIKSDIISKVVWPKLKESIRESITLISVAGKLLESDAAYKKLDNFAKTNSMTLESAVFLLQQKDDVYKNLRGSYKIQKDSVKIIDQWNKYSNFTNAAVQLSQFYLDTSVKIMDKYLPADVRDKMMNEHFFFQNGQDLSLKDIVLQFKDIGLTSKISKYKPQAQSVSKTLD